jgi:hypothetical protein
VQTLDTAHVGSPKVSPNELRELHIRVVKPD